MYYGPGRINSQNRKQMKVIYLYLIMMPFMVGAFSQAEHRGQKIDTPGKIEQWNVFELILQGPTDGNPFIEINLSAEFTNGDRKINVTGFYDGDSTYIVRFMPDTVGLWKYITMSNNVKLNGKKGEFTCLKPSSGNHGPVRIRNTYHFCYEDGTPYYPFGTTCYAWAHQGDALEEQTLQTLRSSPFNKLRMCVFPKYYSYYDKEPVYYPFERDASGKSDLTRFNPVFWHHFEKRIQDLCKLGIEADIILFHPYDFGRWGYDKMPPEADERYIRYAISRLSAYRNVWWSMANEAMFMDKPDDFWDRVFHLVLEADPYKHLRSIHAPKKDEGTYPITHSSTLSMNPKVALEWRQINRKPLIYDEVGYEGNAAGSWGSLPPQELVSHFWNGTMLGGYVGHSETYLDPNNILWWTTGGVMHGDSPVRIAFLRKIIEEGPSEGLNPVYVNLFPWYRGGTVLTAGKEGEYYLYYLGYSQPAELYLALPPGGPYSIDIIDTWNMTINRIQGEFLGVSTIKSLNTPWEWEGMVKIQMPGKPYIALRIMRVDRP